LISAWPCPDISGRLTEEYALAFDQAREHRVLIVPALFDEANRMRRLTVEVMRRLNGAGVDCFLPDLPGCNESQVALGTQSLRHWASAMADASRHVRATHILAIRGGALVAPADLPGWRYAPVNGASILRQMLRMRMLSAREAGREETSADLLATGRKAGLDLAGYQLSPDMLAGLESATLPESQQMQIGQDLIGGSPLWLRAEPDEDRAQADALAAVLLMGLRA